MTNCKLLTSALALSVAASGAVAQDSAGTTSASAGVGLVAPEDTGFMFGASVGVDGVGSAAASVAETTAVHGFTGYASSGVVTSGEIIDAARPVSASGVLGTFTFDRDVTVNGSLVGLGTTVAEGMATGASGFTGSAFGSGALGETGVGGPGEVTTSSSNTENEAALTGSVSTRANLQLTGAESRFAAGNGTTVSESNEGIAFSALSSDPDFGGISINPLVLSDDGDATVEAYNAFIGLRNPIDFEGEEVLNPEEGVAFAVDSELGAPIDLSISNAGGGSVALSAQTGGFFNGGSSAFGDFEFGGTTSGDSTGLDDSNSFTPDIPG